MKQRLRKLIVAAAIIAPAIAASGLATKRQVDAAETKVAKARTAQMIAELKESGVRKSADELKARLDATSAQVINRLGAARNFEERIRKKIRTERNARFTPTELIQAGYALGTLHAAHDHFSNTGAPTIANNMTERYDALMTSTNRGVLSHNALRKVQHPGTVRRSGTRHD